MDLKHALIIIISGFVGSFGFGLFFRMTKKKIVWAVIGGALTCVVYVLCCKIFENEFFQNVFPALVTTSYAEICARLTKSPSTPYIACSLIPLVPGGALYYTMYYLITSDMINFKSSLAQTARIAAGLAVGIILVTVIIREINYKKFKAVYEEQ